MTQSGTATQTPTVRARRTRVSSVTGQTYRCHGSDPDGRDRRGSSRNRRDRKAWLASPKAGFAGADDKGVNCVHCAEYTLLADLEADRIVPPRMINGTVVGGSYTHGNIQPSCPPCNKVRYEARRRQFATATATT